MAVDPLLPGLRHERSLTIQSEEEQVMKTGHL